MGVRRTRYLPESCPSFMPRGTERSKQKWSETSVLRDCSTSRNVWWQCSLHSIHNPASNSRPPFSQRQSTFRIHYCNRLHCPAQIKSVLAVANRSDWNREAKPWIQNRDIAGIDKMGSDCAPPQSIQFATQIHHACGSVFRNRNWSAAEKGKVVTPIAAESRNIERHERAGIIA